MSKIGKLPITIKPGVTIQLQGDNVSVSGPKGNFTYTLPNGIHVKMEENVLTVQQKKQNDEKTRAVFGLARALLNNMVQGVSDGFEKKLELAGVGYRAAVQGVNLSLSVGYSHPVIIPAPQGITFAVKDNTISVQGADKVIVGQVAAQIRSVRPPEPYKGKGIKYQGEHIRRKAGKAAKAVGGK